jgi:hypothetical protein
VNQAEAYAAERLRQPFGLPGRPAVRYIDMPDHVGSDVLTRLIARRIQVACPDLELTGLSESFPFTDKDLQALSQETSVRDCLRRLAKRYDEIVFPIRHDEDLPTELGKLWATQVAATRNLYGEEPKLKVAIIPEVQNALHAWFDVLKDRGLTGSGPWKKLEFISYPDKQPYGNMSVIRCAAAHVPGIGIAVWLGKGTGQPADLGKRLSFFDANPCKIKTLILLRAADTLPISGMSKSLFEQALNSGRDVRIQPYEPRHLHALMAFLGWYQAALAKVEAVRDVTPEAEKHLQDFLANLSKEMLGWIDTWRKAP